MPGDPARLQLTCETPVGDGVRFAFDALDVRGQVSGPAPIARVEARFGGRTVVLALHPADPNGPAIDPTASTALRFSGSLAVHDLPPGLHALTVVALDHHGGTATETAEIDVQPFDELPEDVAQWGALLANGVPVARLERRGPDVVRPGWPATIAVTGFASCTQGLARLSLIVDRRHATEPFHGLFRPDLERPLGSRAVVRDGFRAELLGLGDTAVDRELVVLAVAPDGRATGWRGTLPAQVEARPVAEIPALQPPPTLRAHEALAGPPAPGGDRPGSVEAWAEQALRAEAAREAAEIDHSWSGLQTRLAADRAADAELARRAALARATQPPTFPAVAAPLVSVVVTAYADAERTERCLRALAAGAGSVPFEVIVVDDGDDEDLRRLLDAVVGVRILRNPTNLGYLRSVNRGAAAARGTHIALLNDDTEPQPGWLDALVRRLDADDVGVVAPKLLFPDGRLQEAGSIVWADGTGRNYGYGDDASAATYDVPRDVDYGSAAAILVRGSLWRAVGGFDERYRPAYYEDVDLCFAARARGLRVVYEPTARVVHAHGGSMGAGGLDLSRDLIEANRVVFCAKWAAELRSQSDYAPDAVDAAATRPQPA